MNGIERSEVRDVIVRAFSPDEFDMFLDERFGFDREVEVGGGPFRKVVNDVLRVAGQHGWEYVLVAEVAAARPLRDDVQQVYRKYAQERVDHALRERVEEQRRQAIQRFGGRLAVSLQKAGAAQFTDSLSVGDGGLERKVRDALPFLDADLWLQQLLRLQRQVCRVEVKGRARGTGFLVGPDTVLTNYHVLQEVLEDQVPASAVKMRFDFWTLANGTHSAGIHVSLHPSDWRIDASPCAAAEAAGRPDESPPTPDELDHALVRLDHAVGAAPADPGLREGAARGWVTVPATAPILAPGMPLFILQYPDGGPLKLALDTEGVLWLDENGTRVRYATNTEPGSSGSPCFDVRWSLVALHHYGDPAYRHPARYNQGVPIIAIRERLRRKGKEAVLAAVAP